MTSPDPTLDLVRRALAELDAPGGRLSVAARTAARVARLRDDWEALYWLQYELTGGDASAMAATVREVAPHYPTEALRALDARTIEASLDARTFRERDARTGRVRDGDKVLVFPMPELEEQLEHLERTLAGTYADPPAGYTVDEVVWYRNRQTEARVSARHLLGEVRGILDRIAARVHDFLSRTERELTLARLRADALEVSRQYVSARLAVVSPPALEQLAAAHERLRDGTREGRSHALTSCRRALKSLADALYPPPGRAVVGADGKRRELTDAQFVNRLWQFVNERAVGANARPLLAGAVEQVGTRVNHLNGLSSKGVHGDVDEFEASLCVGQTYMVIADLLRLADQTPTGSTDDGADHGSADYGGAERRG